MGSYRKSANWCENGLQLRHHQPDLEPDMSELLDTICKLADLP